MPEYEGFVASLKEDGKAEVIVRAETSGIVGAPGVSKKVCHCASSSSQVTMEALNPVQAAVGDRVAVRVDASLLLRNAGALIGMPVLALALGWAVSFFIPESEVLGVPVRFLCLFCSLPLGVAAGSFCTGIGPGGICPVSHGSFERGRKWPQVSRRPKSQCPSLPTYPSTLDYDKAVFERSGFFLKSRFRGAVKWTASILKKRPEPFWTPVPIATYAGSSWTPLVLSFLSSTGSMTGNWKEGKKPPPRNCGSLVDLCNFCGQCPCPNIRAGTIEAKTQFIERDGLKFGVRTIEDVERVATIVRGLSAIDQRTFPSQLHGCASESSHGDSSSRGECPPSLPRPFPTGQKGIG